MMELYEPAETEKMLLATTQVTKPPPIDTPPPQTTTTTTTTGTDSNVSDFHQTIALATTCLTHCFSNRFEEAQRIIDR